MTNIIDKSDKFAAQKCPKYSLAIHPVFGQCQVESADGLLRKVRYAEHLGSGEIRDILATVHVSTLTELRPVLSPDDMNNLP